MTTSAVRDGTVYGGAANADDSGTLYAVDAATGNPVWSFVAPGKQRFRSPAVDETSVYVGTGGGPVYALSRADGSVSWTFDTTAEAEAAISVVGDTLFFVGDDNNVIALDKATGSERWRVALGKADGVEAGTTVADGRILLGTAAGNILAVAGSDEAYGTPAPIQSADASAASASGPASPVGELTAPGGLAVPVDVTADPTGNLWVQEGGANRFAIFGPDGTFIERWGKAGSGDGEFNMTPNCCAGSQAAVIAFAKDGGFYVNDPGNYRIQRFDKHRKYIGSIGRFGDKDGQLIDPQGVAVDDDGLIYVPDSTRGDVQVFDDDGRFVRALTGSGTGASGLMDTGPGAVVIGDEVYVVDRGGFSVFKTDGSGVRRIESPAFGNVVDPNLGTEGLLWTADWDAMFHAVDPASGEVVETWKVGPGWPASDVQGVGVAEDGTVYVAEWEFGKVEIFKAQAAVARRGVSESRRPPPAARPAHLERSRRPRRSRRPPGCPPGSPPCGTGRAGSAARRGPRGRCTAPRGGWRRSAPSRS